jgi:large subunit ribosomal protein L44e
MKVPKQRKMYCKKCQKHTNHKVSQVKKRGRSSAHPLSRGSTPRLSARGLRRGFGNYGRYSKPTKPKMTGKKASTKTNLSYTCEGCKKIWIQKQGIRAKKVVIE